MLFDIKKTSGPFSDLQFNAARLIPSEVDQIALSTPEKVDVLNIFRVFWSRFTKLLLACAHDSSTNVLSAKAIFFNNRNRRLVIQLVHTVDQYKLNK